MCLFSNLFILQLIFFFIPINDSRNKCGQQNSLNMLSATSIQCFICHYQKGKKMCTSEQV